MSKKQKSCYLSDDDCKQMKQSYLLFFDNDDNDWPEWFCGLRDIQLIRTWLTIKVTISALQVCVKPDGMKGRENCCGILGRYLVVRSMKGRDVLLQGGTARRP